MYYKKLFLLASVFLSFATIAIGARATTQKLHQTNVISKVSDSSELPSATVPDFGKYKNINKKKLAFFKFMLPFAEKVNAMVLKSREKLLKLHNKSHISSDQQHWLANLAKQYRIKKWDVNSKQSWEKILKRVDVVPNSMILAQSANESAWGMSRFAKKGNNMFGQWCYTKGCGIVPTRRTKGGKYEVRKFSSVLASVKSYVMNINTNKTYALFRNLREKSRLHHQVLSGYKLARGLLHYSQRGAAYVTEIRAMITHNNLIQYDDRV